MSFRRLVLISLCFASLAACSKVTQENYEKLETGMKKGEVEELLGKPSNCSSAVGVSSCTWGDEKTFISVQYAAERVLMFSSQGLK